MYAATKLAQEHLCRAWSTANAVPLTVLRLQNVYGPGQSLTNAYTGIVTLFSTLAAQGRSADVFEDGDVVRDFVYIDDVVDAFARVLTKSSPGVRTLDVGSGTSTRLIELAELVAQLTGAPPPRVTGAYRAGDVRASICDITAAEEELGFSPQWDLRRGLEALLRWVADEAGSAS